MDSYQFNDRLETVLCALQSLYEDINMSRQQSGVGLVKKILTNGSGAPYVNNTVQIVDQLSNQPLRIYADAQGMLATNKVGMTKTDGTGTVNCYLPMGREVRINVIGGGNLIIDTFSDVNPGDPSQLVPGTITVGIFSTSAALQAGAPAVGNAGKTGLVGSSAPYVTYISDGSAWNPISTGAVSTVAGKTGAVTLATTDLTDGASLNTSISNLNTAVAGKVATTSVGAANGVAGLDSSGKVPTAQLPTTSQSVTSVAGKTGVVTLATTDLTDISTLNSTIAAKVASSTVGAANGVAGLGSDGKVPSAQLPATSNAVNSVAGKTGVVTLATTDLTDIATLNATIAGKATNYGIYATLAALISAHTASSSTGNFALIGSAAPYSVYQSNGTVWNMIAYGLGVPSGEASDRALSNSDNGKNLIASGTRAFTVNTGLISGFGASFKGTVSFTGTATVTDVRQTGATNPWCALMNTGTDTYDVVGSKA